MKVLVCAFLTFGILAVVESRFSRSLIKETKPLLENVLLQVRQELEAKLPRDNSSRYSDPLVDQLIAHLRETLQDLMNQINHAISLGQEVTQHLLDQVQDVLAQLELLGAGQNGRANERVKEIAQKLVADLVSFTAERSRAFQETQLLMIQLNLPELYRSAVFSILQDALTADQINNVLSQYFTSGHKNVKSNQLSESREVTDILSLLTTFLSLLWSFGDNSMVAMQAMVAQFFEAAQLATNWAVEKIADQLLNFLRPVSWLLGDLYCKVVVAVEAIVGHALPNEGC